MSPIKAVKVTCWLIAFEALHSGGRVSLDKSGWTLFDLPGDATAIASGTHAELTAASGGVRNLWRDNIDAPRLLQDVVDEDFSVTLKFDGQPDSRVAGQGFVAQTDDDTFLR